MGLERKKRKWIMRKSQGSDSDILSFSARYGVSPMCASLIFSRGCKTAEDAYNFINKSSLFSRDPFIMADMRKAVERIEKAIDNENEVVALYGDYDVDGVTSVSLLYLYLYSRGVRVGYYIPNRSDEGYGVHRSAIDILKQRGVTLIITVDTGITAIEETEYAAGLGIDMIVTDHHECRPELPDAAAVVNPHRPDCQYPFKDFAGVGVVFKLVCALERSRAVREGDDPDRAQRRVLLDYADLAAIGTISDVMPLVDENRMIVTYGLLHIDKIRRLGVAALIDAANTTKNTAVTLTKKAQREINAGYIGFSIAPRLNAAGRMDSAAVAVELLLAVDKEKAAELAEQLCYLNSMRQTEENKVSTEAFRKIEDEEGYTKGDKVIVLSDDSWKQGIIGIVASRVTEKYGLPSIMVTFEGMATPGYPSPFDIGKGSGRSVKGMNLVSALTSSDDLLLRYGGHELAAGLSLTRGNLKEFRRKINEYACDKFQNEDLTVTYEADAYLEPTQISIEFARELASIMEPCGVGNPTPLFIMENCTVENIRPVGGGKHLRITLGKNGYSFQAMFFGVGEVDFGIYTGEQIDALFSVGINTFAGETNVQLLLTDVRYSAKYVERRMNDRRTVLDLIEGKNVPDLEKYIPCRQDFIRVYNLILNGMKGGTTIFTDAFAVYALRGILTKNDSVNYIKYRIIIEVFDELGIFEIRRYVVVPEERAAEQVLPLDAFGFIPVEHEVKIDLESSGILRRLRGES